MTDRSQSQARNERRRLRRALLKQINEVIDPCSTVAGAPAGLVDFGLIRGVDLSKVEGGNWNVRVRMMLTEPTCIMGGPFAVRIHEKLAPLPSVASVEIQIAPVGQWTERAMSKRYATQLAAARAQRIIPIVQQSTMAHA